MTGDFPAVLNFNRFNCRFSPIIGVKQRFLIWLYGGYLLTNSKRCDTCKGKNKKNLCPGSQKTGCPIRLVASVAPPD